MIPWTRILILIALTQAAIVVTGEAFKVNKLVLRNGDTEPKINDKVTTKDHITKSEHAPEKFEDGNCLLCVLFVRHGMGDLKKHGNITKIIKLIENACIYLRLEAPIVCKGGVDVFGQQAAMLLREVDLSPEEVCFLAFPDQCSVSRIKSSSQDWKIDLPPYLSPKAASTESKIQEDNVLKVLHISDVHVDLKYVPGGNAECGEPLCCRAKKKPKQGFLSKFVGNWTSKAYSMASKFSPSEHKTEPADGAGYWGDYRGCDLPSWTFESMLETIVNGLVDNEFNINGSTSNTRHIDYIIWTGDIASHDIWDQSQLSQKFLLKYMTAMLRTYFPNTRVFPVAGNHDSFPSNNYPPFGNTKESRSSSWIYETLAEVWSPWLPEHALRTVKLGAYYTVVVQPGFRIVSLNTNFCYSENWWVFLSSSEPAGMLNWFVDVLRSAEEIGEKVHVIGHVPPGRYPDCLPNWSEMYFRIIERFRNTITGQYFGHTHFDEIQLFYGSGDEPEPISVAYLAPSVTPYVDMNPGFRVYDIAGFYPNSSWSVLNHRTYVLNLTEANHSTKEAPKWKLEYDAQSAFNLESLLPRDWGKLVRKWKGYFESERKGTSPATLEKYVKFYSKSRLHGSTNEASSQNSNLPCENMACARKIVCDIIKNRLWQICLM
ncbi:sphingomyelin phosphodiesterase-like [Styela clava]